MRRMISALGIWAIATIAAIALASTAIGIVAGRAGNGISAVVPFPEAATSPLEPTGASTTDRPSAAPTQTPPGSDPRATPTSPPSDPAESESPADARAPGSETRTYDLVGGSAAISFSADGVDLVWATPADGFSVDVEDDDGGRELTVEFRSEAHRSRVKAWSEEGRFRDRVEEDPR